MCGVLYKLIVLKFTAFVEVLQADNYLASTADVLLEKHSKCLAIASMVPQSRESLIVGGSSSPALSSSSPEMLEDSVFRRDSGTQ